MMNMGIKHFYTWFKKHNADAITKTLLPITHLLIDMNGIIHESAQYVYKYGAYEDQKRLLKPFTTLPSIHVLTNEIKSRVIEIVSTIQPSDIIYLAIDGVAPMSKQNQQRQRRFRTTITPNGFDSNNITAGTAFMKSVSNLLQPTGLWLRTKARVILSTDDKPGEGEHKLVDYIRHDLSSNAMYCIVGLDADLIMLGLLLQDTLKKYGSNVCIFRDNWIIDFNKVRLPVDPKEFVVLGCLVGNDFLPSIPSISIRDGGFDFILDLYKRQNKCLIVEDRIQVDTLVTLMSTYANHEQQVMDDRAAEGDARFPNMLWKGCISTYRRDYHEQKLKSVALSKVVEDYITGLQWVYTYYTKGIPSWRWYYPHHYAPHTEDIALHAVLHSPYPFNTYTSPTTHTDQLLRVLPPWSRDVLPKSLVKQHKSLPSTCVIDKDGKHQEWEGIAIVDFIPCSEL